LDGGTIKFISVIKRETDHRADINYADFQREFLVTTDASDYATGAVLSQGPIGQDRPIAYASRILRKAEENYNTTEKELLASMGNQILPTLFIRH